MTHLLATAKCSFHGTSISVYQKNEINLPHKKFIYEKKTHFKSTMPELPENYTNIMPAKCGKPEFMNPLSFSALFSRNLNPYMNISDISALLPLLPESINSTAMVRDCITVICNII